LGEVRARGDRRRFLPLVLVAATILVAVACEPQPDPATVVYRVNVGGPTTAANPSWSVDTLAQPSPLLTAGGAKTSFTGATINLQHPSVPLDTPMALFQTERYDPAKNPEMAWTFPVAPGAYKVRLYFAETYALNFAVGKRVFDVNVEGSQVLNDYDIFADVGALKGVVKSFTVQAGADGDIDLSFGHVVENPIVNAIEILRTTGTGPPVLVTQPSNLQVASTVVGSTATAQVQLSNSAAAGGASINIQSATITGGGASAFATDLNGVDTALAPGESTAIAVRFTPPSATAFTATLNIAHNGANSPSTVTLNGTGTSIGQPGPVSFGKTLVGGLALPAKPTSLQWGPDGKLYVAQNDGTISVVTLQRNGANSYQATGTENITLVKNVPNHDDDGAPNTTIKKRLVTGLLVAGTSNAPIVYAVSSDPRIGGGTSHTDLDLDTNSGILSRLDKQGGTWVKTDLVRGLPRSEENHMSNGLALANPGTLLIAQGGNTNHGAPSDNFAGLSEFALSAAILSVDLNAIGSTTYDLPTLDDEDRAGTNDANDPFGGNEGKNQARLVPGGPVQIYASGFRNAYDMAVTSTGLYTIDNGGNAGWGGVPVGEGPGGTCTNELVNGGPNLGDTLHRITSAGYYGGHPNPTRASTNNKFNSANPQSPVSSGHAVECDWKPQNERGALANFPTSTNGITQYTTNNFGGALAGDLITASYNNSVYRIDLNAAGTVATVETLFNTVGGFPLDVTASGAADPFPGTLWVTDYETKNLVVYEPADYGGTPPPVCTGVNSPTLDEDGDGFKNNDEILNGTDPCSAADLPPDADGDHVSDLLDNDDDNDGIADPSDAFALDPANGATTQLPLQFTWDNDSPEVGGIMGLGFTGLMTNGTTTWSNQYNPDNMTAGGAAGVLTVDEVPNGDALGATNTQQYGFQVGIDATPAATEPFVLHTRLRGPFAAQVAQNGKSMGIQIGRGNQDNYFKLVASGANGGRMELVKEVNGVVTSLGQVNLPLPGPGDIDLYLEVDPDAATVQAFFDTTTNGTTSPKQAVGAAAAVPSNWFSPGFALGLIATSGGASQPLVATWDFLEAQPLEPTPPTGDTWESLAPLTNNRESVSLVETGGYLYLAGGGCQGTNCGGTHRRYDPLTNTWINIRALPQNLSHLQGVVVNGLIYYVGGQIEPFPGDETDTVYIYNPATNTFANGTSMPAGRGRAAGGVATYQGQIYVAGGLRDGHSGTSTAMFDRYNPATGQWTTMPNMPRVRDHFHAAVVGDKFYVMGGRNSPLSLLGALIAEIDVFNFTTGTWSTLPTTLPTLRGGAGTVAVGNEVIVMGGETPTGVPAVVEAYNTQTGTWRNLTPMLTPRHGMQAAVCNGGIYVVGGSTAPTHNPTNKNEVLKLATFAPCRAP
jgi:N-acetylneuraminic acid mutarotase